MIDSLPIITDRLILNEFSVSDAPFLVQLMNTPNYIKYIGDRGVRTEEQAAQYITEKLTPSYENDGFGFYIARLRHMDFPIGLIGVVKRDLLPAPDLGFALLDEYSGSGYAYEGCLGVVEHSINDLQLPSLLAVTTSHNGRSKKLLTRLEFEYSHEGQWYNGEAVQVYERKL